MADGQKIEVTQTGSLPRSKDLIRGLLQDRARGEPRSADTTVRAATAVSTVVRRQLDVGVDIVGDGEQGRVGFQIYVPQRYSGFGGVSERSMPTDWRAFPAFHQRMLARISTIEAFGDPPAAVGDVMYTGARETQQDCEILVTAVADANHPPGRAFITAPSPGLVATTFRNRHYDSYEAYLRAVATQVRREYEVVLNAGLILQIDAPDLAMERTMYFGSYPLRKFLEFAELHVDVLNSAIEGLPRDRLRLHCCWGNQESPHTDDVPLAELLPIISRANVGALGIAFANPRHQHETALVADIGLPDDMVLIAGVIDTTTNFVEHPEVVSRRLQEVVRAMGDVGRVIASPDCGFNTFAGLDWVAEDVVWAKFRSLRDGADRAAAALGMARGGSDEN